MSTTFNRLVAGTYDPETDTEAGGSSTTVVGSAFEKMSGAVAYFANLNLVEANAKLLVFTPSTYGQEPEPGDTVTWASEIWTVKNVQSLAPDGVVILSYVVIVR